MGCNEAKAFALDRDDSSSVAKFDLIPSLSPSALLERAVRVECFCIIKCEKPHKYEVFVVPNMPARIQVKLTLGSSSLSPDSHKVRYIFSGSPRVFHSGPPPSPALH